MKWSEKNDLIAPAIVAASAEIGNLFPDAKGHGYDYIPLETIIATVKPICHKNGLAVIQGPTKADNGIGIETMILHTSGQWLHTESGIRNLPDSKSMNVAQADGATITYLRRYSLSAVFLITSDKDIDAATQGEKPTPPTTGKTLAAPEPEKSIADEKRITELTVKFNEALPKLFPDPTRQAAIRGAYNDAKTADAKLAVYYRMKSRALLDGMDGPSRDGFEKRYQSDKDMKKLFEDARAENDKTTF
jgi:hypothetical protein